MTANPFDGLQLLYAPFFFHQLSNMFDCMYFPIFHEIIPAAIHFALVSFERFGLIGDTSPDALVWLLIKAFDVLQPPLPRITVSAMTPSRPVNREPRSIIGRLVHQEIAEKAKARLGKVRFQTFLKSCV